jgi:transketolase
VYCLSTSEEAEVLVGQALSGFAEARRKGEVPTTKIFFLGREDFPQSLFSHPPTYKLGQGQIVFEKVVEGRTITLVGAGALLHQAVAAAKELVQEGYGAVVVNPSRINLPDVKLLSEALEKSEGRMVTVEDHQLIGGMGAQISHALLMAGQDVKLKSLGVRDEFGQSAYKAAELYRKHGLDAASIAAAAKDFFF